MQKTYVNRQWRLTSRPANMLDEANFCQTTEEINDLKVNQVLIETNILSFDPTQRIWAIMDSYVPKIPLNEVMRAFGIGQVVESKHAKFKRGDFVYANLGWQDYKLIDTQQPDIVKPQIIPGFLDPTLVVALSITGFTAWLGIEKLAQVKKGDRVLVSGAAGAVGSIVCQIAKHKGAYVVGIAGGQHKCQYLLNDLGLDGVIDYKQGKLDEQISQSFPKGLDIYYDNVGGELLELSLTHLRKFSRVILCGAISQYNDINENSLASGHSPATKNVFNLIAQSARMQGFVLLDYMDEFNAAIARLYHWVQQGKIKQAIDMQQGFDNIPTTLTRLFDGKNIGKQLLTLREPSLPSNQAWLMEKLFHLSQYWYR